MRPSFFAWVMVPLPVCGLVAGGATALVGSADLLAVIKAEGNA